VHLKVVLMFEFVRVWRAFWRFKVATVSGSGNAFQTAFDLPDRSHFLVYFFDRSHFSRSVSKTHLFAAPLCQLGCQLGLARIKPLGLARIPN
jgi:hypothetical protein